MTTEQTSTPRAASQTPQNLTGKRILPLFMAFGGGVSLIGGVFYWASNRMLLAAIYGVLMIVFILRAARSQRKV